MKALLVAFIALAVGASAYPNYFEVEQAEQRNIIVENQIRAAIADLSQAIRDNGLDPVDWRRVSIENSPQENIIIRLLIEELHFSGLSNIVARVVNFSTLGSRLRLTIELPRITFRVSNTELVIDFFGTEYTGTLQGDFQLTNIVLTFDIRLNISIIGGISVRTSEVTFVLGGIRSNFILVVNGESYTEELNNIINYLIPAWIRQNQPAINQFLSDLVKNVVNDILSRSGPLLK